MAAKEKAEEEERQVAAQAVYAAAQGKAKQPRRPWRKQTKLLRQKRRHPRAPHTGNRKDRKAMARKPATNPATVVIRKGP